MKVSHLILWNDFGDLSTVKMECIAYYIPNEWDKYMMYMNMSGFVESDYLLTTAFYQDVNEEVIPPFCSRRWQYAICSSGCTITQPLGTRSCLIRRWCHIWTSRTMEKASPPGNACTCSLGKEPCKNWRATKIMQYHFGIGGRVAKNTKFAQKTSWKSVRWQRKMEIIGLVSEFY